MSTHNRCFHAEIVCGYPFLSGAVSHDITVTRGEAGPKTTYCIVIDPLLSYR